MTDLLLIIAFVLWSIGLAETHLSRAQGPLGLVPALSPAFYAGLVLLCVSFAMLLASGELRRQRLGIHVAGLVVMMQAPVPILYGAGVYYWNFKGVGEAQSFVRYGRLQPNLDIYQRFPGFYAFADWFGHLAGFSSPLSYIKWVPLVFFLLATWAFWFAASALPIPERARWLAVGLFCASEWYLAVQAAFTPQAPGFFLDLIVLGLVLRLAYRTRQEPVPALLMRFGLARWWRLIDDQGVKGPEDRHPVEADRRRRSALAAGMALVAFVAIVVGHPLSPIVLLLQLGALLAVNRLNPRWTVVACAAILVAFVAPSLQYLNQSHGALQGIGNVAANISAPKVSGATTHLGPNHVVLPALIGLLGAAALAGLVRWRRSWRTILPVVVLGGAPLALVALVHYGQETSFRSVMFAEPWVSCVAACAFFSPSAPAHGVKSGVPAVPADASRWLRTVAPVASVLAAITVLSFVAQVSQNEIYEVAPADIAAALWFYHHAPPGVAVYIDGNFPDSIAANYGTFLSHNRYHNYAPRIIGMPSMLGVPAANYGKKLDRLVCDEATGDQRDGYLIVSKNQWKYAEDFGLVEPTFPALFESFLIRSGYWRVYFRNSTTTIYVVSTPCSRRFQ